MRQFLQKIYQNQNAFFNQNSKKLTDNSGVVCLFLFQPGADLGFSQEMRVVYSKNFQKFCRPFFRSDQIHFRALSKHYKELVLAIFFCFGHIFLFWPHFLGRTKLISELSQSIIKSLFWPYFFVLATFSCFGHIF